MALFAAIVSVALISCAKGVAWEFHVKFGVGVKAGWLELSGRLAAVVVLTSVVLVGNLAADVGP